MVPYNENQTLEFDTDTEQPERTYALVMSNTRLIGTCDELEAVKQAIILILGIERYKYPIFSWNYGIELQDLFGKPNDYVQTELERRISEALTWDDRIDSVDSFSFSKMRGQLTVEFTVHTKYGSIEGVQLQYV